ncbi:MAG: RimK family protein [Syntrophales bacterium]|nr:RimK family protein [Syntrophales bacterium]
MSTHIVLVEKKGDWKHHYPEATVVSARDYLGRPEYHRLRDIRVINLCRSYRYLSMGYYCSLLAQARRHKIIPSVRTITDLSSRAIYSLNTEDLDPLVQRSLKKHRDDKVNGDFEIDIFFGLCRYPELQELAHQIFDLFRCPLLRVEFRLNVKWNISAIKPAYLGNLSEEGEAFFLDAFGAYTTKRWTTPRAEKPPRYDLAVLFDPANKLPPSNERAIRKFVLAGKKLGVNVEMIGKKDFSRIAEYDALFIRETTNIDHYTYRFAQKAESEGLVVIDDPDSIVKCTNKVYLTELLAANRIPTPKTAILQKLRGGRMGGLPAEISYPLVLKIPDGSFSRGVHKVNTLAELEVTASRLFKESDLILAQEFLYTEFDWRIGILNRTPIFACQYFMSKRHWQIVKHSPSGRFTEGDATTWLVEEAPEAVVTVALKAANLIGGGLYGVDVKQTKRGVFIMEINDNPNIDAGVEDKALGVRLYETVIGEFVRRLDLKRAI